MGVQWIGEKWTGTPPMIDGLVCPECNLAHIGVDKYCLSCYPPHKRYLPPQTSKVRPRKPYGVNRSSPTEKDRIYLESMGIRWD